MIDTAIDSGPTFKGYDANEGGEVRAEYIRFANGNAGYRVTTFLYKDSGTTKYFPFVTPGTCNDLSGKTVWPVATNPVAERVYMDPGAVVITGGPTPIVVPRSASTNPDPFGRVHQANNWFFQPPDPTMNIGGNYLSANTGLSVTFAGSPDMPAQAFDNVLFMPADFALSSPGAVPIAIAADTDQTFTWTTPTSNTPAGYTVQSLVAFTAPGAAPVVACVEPNDGSITVPAALINVVRATFPSGGSIARQTLTHVVRELVDKNGPTGRRIDFISVWCYATPFSVP